MLYSFAANVIKVFLSLFGRINISHKERLPKNGGYVIACTHTGWVDILWLGVATMPTKLHFMAKKELFENGFTRWLLTNLKAFPVNRENPGPSAIKIPKKLLKEGKVIGIFPSGTRTQEDVPLKRGAVTIAMTSDVPLVPAAYVGPNNFSDLKKRQKPMIMYGEPIIPDPEMSKKEKMAYLSSELEKRTNALKEELQMSK
ncbi:lysophospholipid acyltransferase family protein [Virgibacillus halophilus]|uniref:lysophospholipid acyltransferase family protein n=1 Tax=Tigheibacillus halophilus TaxID=361280 RepID=UPI00363B1332